MGLPLSYALAFAAGQGTAGIWLGTAVATALTGLGLAGWLKHTLRRFTTCDQGCFQTHEIAR